MTQVGHYIKKNKKFSMNYSTTYTTKYVAYFDILNKVVGRDFQKKQTRILEFATVHVTCHMNNAKRLEGINILVF